MYLEIDQPVAVAISGRICFGKVDSWQDKTTRTGNVKTVGVLLYGKTEVETVLESQLADVPTSYPYSAFDKLVQEMDSYKWATDRVEPVVEEDTQVIPPQEVPVSHTD